MADIFLSYSREDEARVKHLVSEFEARGWSVFWDRRIPAGQTWRSHIGSALQGSRCIVVAWSSHSIESQWVAEEADEGKTRDVLVPVLLDRVQPPRGFREIQAADLSDWQPGQPSERLAELLSDLQRLLGEPAVSPAAMPSRERVAAVERPPAQPSSPTSGPSPRVVAIALLSLVALAGAGYLLSRPKPHGTDSVVASPTATEPGRSAGTGTAAGTWFVVAGSFAAAQRPAAEQRRAVLARAGHEAVVIDSNDFPLLSPNLWVVALGPFESAEAAKGALSKAKTDVPDAYLKRGR